MKLISRIKPYKYFNSSFIWWNMNRDNNNWRFTLGFWLFVGLFKIDILKGLKIKMLFYK